RIGRRTGSGIKPHGAATRGSVRLPAIVGPGGCEMAVTWLKKAAKTPASEEGTARAVVTEMLARIEAGGEQAVLDYAKRLDGWEGPVVVGPEEIARRAAEVDEGTKRDIDHAIANVRRFAEAQRESVREFSIELAPGLVAG